jgi:queuine tRNA-ribosyltransferase
MQFDECTPYLSVESATKGQITTEREARLSMELSLRWAARCKTEFARLANPNALFGIVQGGMFEHLREESLAGLESLDLPGIAVGGLSVGEPKDHMMRILEHIAPQLPDHKPRYLMGVGTPEDLIAGVQNGIDMFDCVLPTRCGRNSLVYTFDGQLRLRNAQHATDPRPLEAGCPCLACRHSRSYIRHLFLAGEMLGPILASIHNLTFYQRLVARLRDGIVSGSLPAVVAELRRGMAAGDDRGTDP